MACLTESSAPLRKDDDYVVRVLPPLVISSEAEKYERPGVWERVPRKSLARDRVSKISYPHACTVVSLHFASRRSR
jgi:hypothetical protein